MPSEDTQDRIYNQATRFAQENRSLKALEESVGKEQMETSTTSGLTKAINILNIIISNDS